MVTEEASNLPEGERVPLGVGLHVAGQHAEAFVADRLIGHLPPVDGLDELVLNALPSGGRFDDVIIRDGHSR